MSKNYNDVKRAAEAALKGLIKAIKENLKGEEVDQLLIELSMSLFTASLDFDLPFDKFAVELANKQASYTVCIAETIIGYKRAIDAGKGDDYDFEEI